MSEIKEIECSIIGRVTGVMFRDFVCRQARRFGLIGTVQNQPDRTVRVVAQGDETSLRQLISELNRGSIFSNVEKVEVIWRAPIRASEKKFKIIYG